MMKGKCCKAKSIREDHIPRKRNSQALLASSDTSMHWYSLNDLPHTSCAALRKRIDAEFGKTTETTSIEIDDAQ